MPYQLGHLALRAQRTSAGCCRVLSRTACPVARWSAGSVVSGARGKGNERSAHLRGHTITLQMALGPFCTSAPPPLPSPPHPPSSSLPHQSFSEESHVRNNHASGREVKQRGTGGGLGLWGGGEWEEVYRVWVWGWGDGIEPVVWAEGAAPGEP